MPTNNYHLRSEEIQEIIGQIPPWTIRWGIAAIFFVFMILLFCSYYIQFPDVLPAKAMISAKEQPFRVSWYRNGPHVHKVYIKEGQQVKAGDTLVVEQSLMDGSRTPFLSPVSGKAIFLKGGEDNPRKSTMIIYPPLVNLEVELNIAPKGSGQVKRGQKVLMKLDAYPAGDFGMLEGQITSDLSVPIDGSYRVKVALLHGLRTTENKTIPPQHFMTGSAEILLDNKNLFHRIFGSLYSI